MECRAGRRFGDDAQHGRLAGRRGAIGSDPVRRWPRCNATAEPSSPTLGRRTTDLPGPVPRPRATGHGPRATVEITSLHDDALPAFLHDLADDFRGWPGVPHWRSLEDQLRLEATHDRLGHVTVLTRLRPRAYLNHWDVCLPLTIEAGAEMTALADTLTLFFHGS